MQLLCQAVLVEDMATGSDCVRLPLAVEADGAFVAISNSP
jgi:hypothetical protein